MRDSFIFYRSFFEAIEKLPKKKQLKVYQNIASLALNFVEQEELTGQADMVFGLIKPQVTANIKKYENGCKAKQNGSTASTSEPSTASTSEPSTAISEEQANVNVNVFNENANVFNENVFNAEFDRFWKIYDKDTSKKQCTEKWKKITQANKDIIFKTLPAYVKSTPDKKFRFNPWTYLNSEGWNNEIITTGQDTAPKEEEKINYNTRLK